MTNQLIKQDLDAWLDQVDYSYLNSSSYVPSEFALTFMNFIKLVNGEVGESNKTPPVHLKMLDKLTTGHRYIANLCHRGLGKTTIFGEYLILYLAIFEALPVVGNVSGLLYVSDSMENGVKSARKNIEFRYNNSEFLQTWIPEVKFTDAYMEFKNRNGTLLGVRMFGSKSGIRGTKIFGKRPTLAILDDLVGDDDAKSRASMEAIKDTVYKGIIHALDPTNNMIIFNGTPFNKMDILLEAVESGAWDVNVWPVCETFPCTKEEFQGSWEDRFSYESVLEQYNLAEKSGRLSSFYQELMLRITSEDERLVQDSEIHWYKREVLLRNKSNFNFYITTDFATSAKQTADKCVISVWAYSSNADWFWVDGVAEQMTMDKTLDHLFRLVSMYKPQSVGIEITGQQGGFIPWLQNEQIVRNIWFNFANMAGSTQPGIRPSTDKLSRFNLVVPWFKAGKFYFPDEMRRSKIMVDFMGEIRLATHSGLKGKDDCIDTISMLGYLNPWKPSDQIPTTVSSNSVMWDDYEQEEDNSRLSSYII